MNVFQNLRPLVVAITVAASLVNSPQAFADENSQLALSGKDWQQNRVLLDAVMHDRNYVVEVDRLGKIKQVLDAGVKGSGKEVKLPVVTTATVMKAATSVDLPLSYQGQAAIDFIGSELALVAESHGLSVDKLKDILLTDKTVHIDSTKHIFYVDEALLAQNNTYHSEAGALTNVATANSQQLPIGSTITTTNAFALHSKPGASKTIYLDFDGYQAVNTAWAPSTTLDAPAFDLDGNPNGFSDVELTNIMSVWSRVSEDYIPFDVDVTTEAPSNEALLRSSSTDTNYGTRVVITKTGVVSCSCGGIAYLGVVGQINNTAYQPAWVFYQSLNNNEKNIAEAISHEAGHTLGLSHDGQKVGTSVNGYYSGHGSGVNGWAPIMGVGYYKNVTQWSNGAYPNANNKQDDFAVLASNGFTIRTDDVGNTFTTAMSLSNADSGVSATIQTAGVIETASDIDMYRIDTAGGLMTFSANPASTGPNLDLKLTLFKVNGSTISTNAPETDLSASITTTLPAGTYFLSIKGASHSASGSDYGYPTYGSLGQYQLTGSYTSSGIPSAPQAVLTSSTQSGAAALPVSFSALSSVGNGKIVSYQWSFGDGTYSTIQKPSHTYTKAGNYTATLTVTNEFLLTDTQSVDITVTPPPPVTLFASSLRLALLKSTKIGAQAAVTVVDEKNRLVPGALVTGTWSGSFTGSVSGKTALTGVAMLNATAITPITGGTATFTLDKIEVAGYLYNPDRNAKTVVTVTW